MRGAFIQSGWGSIVYTPPPPPTRGGVNAFQQFFAECGGGRVEWFF